VVGWSGPLARARAAAPRHLTASTHDLGVA
jgi:hypothetical protein